MEDRVYDMVVEAMRLIRRRSVDPRRTIEQRISYSSAYDMLMYALQENAECLALYDDVRLDCQDCRKFYSDHPSDIQLCNACVNHEFFEHERK